MAFHKRIADKIKFDITGFYTLFRNAIGLAPYKLNGEDSILYNGVTSAVYANRNVKKAYTYGFNTNITVDFTEQLSFFGTVTYTYGRFKNPNGTKTPQDHIPPVFGKGSLKYSIHDLKPKVMFFLTEERRSKITISTAKTTSNMLLRMACHRGLP